MRFKLRTLLFLKIGAELALIAGLIFACITIAFNSGFEKASLENSYCEAPPEADCSKYVDLIEQWVGEYEEQEDTWLQCQRDLARSQNLLNIEVMCHDRTCRE